MNNPIKHASNFKDLTGQKFGMLTVIEYVGKNKQRNATWKCRCDCGNEKIISSTALLNNGQKSCGCQGSSASLGERSTVHGEYKTRLHRIWSHIKDRCYNKNFEKFKDYGGRGITVCDEWRNSYQAFSEWAKASGYADDLTIDRIDVNGNYEPKNCRWVDYSTQNQNRRICKKSVAVV